MAVSKKTPEVMAAIAENLKVGSTRKAASIAAGISEDSFYEYMKDSEFSELVKAAEAEFVNTSCKAIQEAGQREWRALAWMLERRFPDDFKLRQEIDVGKLSDEQLLRLLARTTPTGSNSAGSDSGSEAGT